MTKLSPEQKQAALQRHHNILQATLDYLLAKNAGSIVLDQKDTVAEYYEQQKRQAGKYSQQHQLGRLQQQLARLTQGLQHRADLTFAAYIKEKTGYEIDNLEDLRKRVDAIIAQQEVRTDKEDKDVGILLHYYQQTSADPALIAQLQDLSWNYHKANSRKKTGYTEVTRTNEKDGVVVEHLRHFSGGKPKHFVEEEAISPDGNRRLRLTQWSDGKSASTFVTIIFPTASGGIFGANGIHPAIKAYWKNNSTIVIELPKDIAGHTQHKEVRSFDDVITIEYIDL